jgi:AcrR family transcriptional regulator
VRAESQRKVLDAARELLAAGNVRDLTLDHVAARSGVAKTTIYRRWSNKHELALTLVIDMVENQAGTPDMGDIRPELTSFVGGVVQVLSSTLMGPVIQALIPEIAAHPELATAFRDRVVRLREAELGRLLQRGVRRGDVRPDHDLELVHELLFGPLYYRLLLSSSPLDAGLAQRVVDAVLPSLRPSGR